METAKGKPKALQGIFGGTVFKGKVVSKGTGPNVNKRARGETQRSAARWGAEGCIGGGGYEPWSCGGLPPPFVRAPPTA